MKVTANVTRSEDWWAVEVPEVPGVFTQARRLSQVEPLVKEAVSLMLEVPAEDVEVAIFSTSPLRGGQLHDGLDCGGNPVTTRTPDDRRRLHR